MKYVNYLFDLYGTLADIRTNEEQKKLWSGLAVWYRSHGAAYTPWELRSAYLSLVAAQKKAAAKRHPGYTHIDIQIEHVFLRLFEQKDVSVSCDTVLETALHFRLASRSYIRLYPQIKTMLQELRAQNKRCILLSNAQRAFTMPELKQLEIAGLFDGILISSDEECAKPDRHFYEAAFGRYHLDPKETIMIGNDVRTDIAGANACGIDSVYIHSNLSPALTAAPKSTYTVLNGDTGKLRQLLTEF